MWIWLLVLTVTLLAVCSPFQEKSSCEEWEEFWKQPSQQQELEKLLKSSSLREEMKKVVEETIQNPV